MKIVPKIEEGEYIILPNLFHLLKDEYRYDENIVNSNPIFITFEQYFFYEISKMFYISIKGNEKIRNDLILLFKKDYNFRKNLKRTYKYGFFAINNQNGNIEFLLCGGTILKLLNNQNAILKKLVVKIKKVSVESIPNKLNNYEDSYIIDDDTPIQFKSSRQIKEYALNNNILPDIEKKLKRSSLYYNMGYFYNYLNIMKKYDQELINELLERNYMKKYLREEKLRKIFI